MLNIVMPNADSSSHPILLSIVVPILNESEVIEETHRRLLAAAVAAANESFEIIYVDDGSTDGTWGRLKAFALEQPRVVAIGLSRNFGHQLALTAGLEISRGGRILMIDGDLQDPPELLPQMMELMNQGADVVYGQRIDRKGETAFKLASASAFYAVLNRLTDVPIPQNVGDFRMVSRQVLDSLRSLPEQHRFVRGMVSWLGFRQVPLPYVRHERFAGVTKYPLRKMMRLAIDAITGFSTIPLRASIWLALCGLILSAGVSLYAIASWWLDDVVRGWASLVVVMSLFASAQLMCLGILGEYVGRMFMESKQRPLAIVREIVTRDSE